MLKVWESEEGKKQLNKVLELLKSSADKAEFQKKFLELAGKLPFKNLDWDALRMRLIRKARQKKSEVGRLWKKLPKGSRVVLGADWSEEVKESFKKDWPGDVLIAKIREKYKNPTTGEPYKDYQFSALGKMLGVSRKLKGSASTTGAEKKKEPPSPESVVLKILHKDPSTIPIIAKELDALKLDASEEEAVRLVDALYRRGYDIVYDRESKSVSLATDPTELPILEIDGNNGGTKEAAGKEKKEIFRYTYKIGVIHGTVLGSKYSNPTLLHTVDATFKKEGVDFVIHLGDVTTGRLSGKRSGESFLASDPEAQISYVLAHYPNSKSHKTYMISGTRDLTFKSKRGAVINVVRRICSDDLRSDLVYRGDLSATFRVRGVRIEAINPGEDYAPYSKSYPLQNIITNLISEEESLSLRAEDEAVIALVGGAHVYDRIKSGNIHGFLVPSLQSLTAYQKGKRKRGSGPTIGACIVELNFDENWKLKQDKGREGVKIKLIKLKKYQKKNDYRASVKVDENLSEPHKKVLRFLDDSPRTEGDISRSFKIHKEKVNKIIAELQGRGYQIITPKDPEQADTKQFELRHKQAASFKPLDLKTLFTERKKIAFVSDTHFGSLDQLPSLIARFYEICENEKVEAVFHCGDWSAGDFNHPANIHKVFIPSAEGQMRFLTDHYPKLKSGKLTYGIGGNHDAQHGAKKGLDAIRNLFVRNRPDIVYLGPDVGMVKLGKLNIELLHPTGGPGYALSYKGQNIIESEIRLNRARKAKEKIHILALGNWHVYNEQIHSETFVVCVPCFQQQTEDYMKVKGLDPWIGGLIYEIVTDEEGSITQITSEFIDMAAMAKTPDFPEIPLSQFLERYIAIK